MGRALRRRRSPVAAHLALRASMRDTIERQVAHLRETFNIWCEKSLPLEDSADLAREFSTRKEATFNVSRCRCADRARRLGGQC